MEKKGQLGKLIREYLEEKSLSIRKFSQSVDIAPSTLSRIINGKQKANIGHLQKLSIALEIPINRLLEVVEMQEEKVGLEGYEEEEILQQSMEELLKLSNLEDTHEMIKDIKKEFTKCQNYIQTEEGSQVIQKGFEEKIKSISGVGPFVDILKKFYTIFITEVPFSQKSLLIGGALLYFITPLDVIPDFLFAIGYLDDMILIQLVLSLVKDVKNI